MTFMKSLFILLMITASAAGASWEYESSRDEMTGKDITFARTRSVNSQDLHWPHGRGVTARLILRKHPRHGKDAIIILSAGQILCRSYEACNIVVRFDDKPPINMRAVGADDGDSKTIFLQGYDRFIRQLQTAGELRIEVPLYQDGNRLFKFEVSGLGGDAITPSKTTSQKTSSTNATIAPALARSKNCLACHSIDRRIVGPAYIEVARKYKNLPDADGRLSAKIRAGGAGVWGTVPMPPNPTVSPEEATILAKWILSL